MAGGNKSRALMAELADALDLGSNGRPCGFESHHRHQIETPSVRVVFLFCYAKRSKIRNVPLPRPCGATGNGARKLHAHFVCGMRCPYAADLMGKQEETAAVKVAHGILYRYFSPICV